MMQRHKMVFGESVRMSFLGLGAVAVAGMVLAMLWTVMR